MFSIYFLFVKRNCFCSVNNGEFLVWSIDYLMHCIDKCEMCNQSEDSNKNESENDSSNQQPASNEDSDKDKKGQSKNKNTSSQKCSICDDSNNLLEQSFNCLFGYKKPRSKYLESHSVLNIKYTLENCINLYNYFMPEEIPEYDHKLSRSISVEVISFCLLNFYYFNTNKLV